MIPNTFQYEINQGLQSFFQKKRKIIQKFDPRLTKLVDQIAEVTLRGGDRMRPYMCWLGFLSSRSTLASDDLKLTDTVPILLALELFQTFALIHDDIMDQALTRRGGPTIHAYFTKNLRNEKKAMSLAILAGDLCSQWAQELFDEGSRYSGKHATVGTSRIRNKYGSWTSQDDNVKKVRQLFNLMREEVILGQTSEVWEIKKRSLAEILKVYKWKSAYYSVQKPLLIGARIGGASEAVFKTLSLYGEHVGLAFQLKDDVLGMFGDEKIIGKSTSSDITEGKWTPLVLFTWNKLAKTKKSKLERIIGSHSTSYKDHVWVKEQMIQTGAQQEVEGLMVELVSKAKSLVGKSSISNKQKLVEVAEFLIERNS